MLKVALVMIAFCLTFVIFPKFATAGEAEKRLVVECAAKSGGQPAAFAGCAIGGLWFSELKKCLFGEPGECLGDTNTGVVWIKAFNRTVLNSCGFRAIDAVPPQLFLINNTDVPVDVDLEFPNGPGGHSRLDPGYSEVWTLDWCDEWVNVDGTGGASGFDAGSVVEFAYGTDGAIHPYAVTSAR